MKKIKKQKKDPNGLNVQRGKLKAEMMENIHDITVLVDHQPWVVVSFYTTATINDEEDVLLQLVGPSKICHPDKFDTGKGTKIAIDRAIAWAIKLIIPPHNTFNSEIDKQLEEIRL